ncbi:hypothetical protein MJ391_11245 [Escherichia coli]|nr:hypothetical protein MJ391_11245 [Escherichia coli]
MTVFENVAFGLRMQKTPAAEITPRVTDTTLQMVQLETFAQHHSASALWWSTATCRHCPRGG